jgi:putative ABC transport system substrate-binding protein
MKRRDFLGTLGAAAAWPLAVNAQQAMPVIGFLSSRSPQESERNVAAFRRGLREAGYIEGQNLIIAFRWAEGRYDRLPALASELVGLRVAAMVAAGGTPPALAAKSATSTIPVIFSAVGDAVGSGLVSSLNRPGGNVTGMSIIAAAVGAKRVEMLKDLVPTISVMAYLGNPLNPNAEREAKEAQTAARTLGIELHVAKASTEPALNAAFESLGHLNVQGLVTAADGFFDSRPDILVALAARKSIATSYPWREYVLAGGLMSYGANLADSYRQAGIYTGKVLKGDKPADLPVMQPTRFDLVINLKAAKALGLTVPPTVLARASEVIE